MQNITKFFFFTKTIYWSSTRNICCYCICRFCWYNIHNSFNFIARNHWSISNTFWIFTIPSNTCARIPTIIFYPLMIIFKFTLTCFIFLFLIWVTCCAFGFACTITWNIFCHCFSFIFICYYIKCFKIYVYVSFGKHIFSAMSLKPPVHLSNVIMNGQYLSSAAFKLARVGLTIHGSSFKNWYFVWSSAKDSLKQ